MMVSVSPKTEKQTEIRIENIVLPSFHDYWWESRNNQYTHYVCKGGRNSSKSTTISLDCIQTLIDEDVNGLAIRRVAATLRESVFEQLKDATILLSVEHLFRFQTSPLKVTYKPKGNYILFRGADDPVKIKSIKTANFPISFVWFEEVDQFKLESHLSIIINSILRKELPKGLKYKFLYSYNPPPRKQHWLNKKYESQFIEPNTYIHTSDYRDNKYLSDQALDNIEIAKKKSLRNYEWEYLGKPIGGGIVPFDKLDFREIADAEIKTFDNIRQGIDWGYAVDPFSFGRWHYDKTRNVIYAMDEIYGVKLPNRNVAERIIEKGYTDVVTTCDSAEPKSIAELKVLGVPCRGAKKGAGSVEYGEKWLDNLDAIIIDPNRTPNIAREFESIDYQVDKDGNTLPRLEDKDNHSVDMARYSFEGDMKSGSWHFM